MKPPVFKQNKRTQWNACHRTEKKKKDHYGKERLLHRDKRITQYIDNRKRRNLATLFQKAITPLVAFSLNTDLLSPLTFITPSTHSPFWSFYPCKRSLCHGSVRTKNQTHWPAGFCHTEPRTGKFFLHFPPWRKLIYSFPSNQTQRLFSSPRPKFLGGKINME